MAERSRIRRRVVFDPDAAAEPTGQSPAPRSRRLTARRVLYALLLIALGALATVAIYEIPESYEDCLLDNLGPGTSDIGARLIDRACRRTTR